VLNDLPPRFSNAMSTYTIEEKCINVVEYENVEVIIFVKGMICKKIGPNKEKVCYHCGN
jgi:hypothetical protein